MRSLAAEYPNNFAYARAKGHSMILWSPWTSAADIRDNVDTVKRSGLLELFDEIGRNRLAGGSLMAEPGAMGHADRKARRK